MKKYLKILLIIILAIVVVVGVVIFVANNALKEAAKLQAYDFGDDKLRSFTSVVGERKVTGVGTSSSTSGVQQKNYTYDTQTSAEDFIAYHNALGAAGYLVTQSKEGDDLKGSIQYGCESADDGKIVQVDLSWENNRFAVELTKMIGTVTPK